jgi:hypothetical protein
VISPEDIENVLADLVRQGMLDEATVEELRPLVRDPARQDELIAKLGELGGMSGPTPPLNIADFYREGAGKFELRWPLDPSIPLPFAFDDLDRKTQFFVLFGEWTRREFEGMTALNAGDVDGARQIFQECLDRAQSIDVDELVARSYEGLMRVAEKQGELAAAQAWSQKAVEARAP